MQPYRSISILGDTLDLGGDLIYLAERAHIGNLWSMYVVPEFRNRGVGAALLDAALAHARGLGGLRQIVLCVTANNLAASALYKSRGFQPFGFERDALFVDSTYFGEEHLALHFDRDP